MTRFLGIMAFLGALLPWVFFGQFLAVNGLAPLPFLQGLFANGAAGGFSTDVLLSILTFWVWSFADARRLGLSRWWLVLPAGCLVGLSLALPLYLLMRQDAAHA
jgi:hypothetical protein